MVQLLIDQLEDVGWWRRFRATIAILVILVLVPNVSHALNDPTTTPSDWTRLVFADWVEVCTSREFDPKSVLSGILAKGGVDVSDQVGSDPDNAFEEFFLLHWEYPKSHFYVVPEKRICSISIFGSFGDLFIDYATAHFQPRLGGRALMTFGADRRKRFDFSDGAWPAIVCVYSGPTGVNLMATMESNACNE